MAFNFNWSPLIADTVRARDMLTTALNKSPKPPIIVDDIIVTELNLGAVPPDLEILEVGDLAEDRFRGIFKMSYAGDAFLTLKTRVQANPLNTYLSTRPSFASPQPLAAASGLTIPLAITLSDIRLSGFVILVFSKQKGLTIVFRNDPLESLKVSSTFDSIPFVRDYLQKVIEEQLRVLFMEDLPAILHRLSLRWSPDYHDPSEPIIPPKEDDTIPIDPLASPLQEPVDWLETVFGDDSIPSMSLDTRTEPTTFSQKNLATLSSLTSSHQTLNITTPTVRDALFRAWAVVCDRNSGIQTPIRPGLSRAQSAFSTISSAYSVNSGTGTELTRPTLSTASSYSYSRPSGRQRKAKRRVIDLRRSQSSSQVPDIDSLTNSSTPEPTIAPSSVPSITLESIDEETAPTIQSEPDMIINRTPLLIHSSGSKLRLPKAISEQDNISESEAPPAYTPPEVETFDFGIKNKVTDKARRPLHLKSSSASNVPLLRSLSADRLAFSPDGSTGGILEQAWMRKMAHEIARRVDEERSRADHSDKGKESRSDLHHVEAPPAYVS